jgi:drug/metabolite transporter (DMT)-like permease
MIVVVERVLQKRISLMLKPPAPSSYGTSADAPNHHHHHHHFRLLGVDLSYLSPAQQFAITTLGIFTCYLIYGLAQEHVTNIWKAEHISLGWWLTLAQCVVYSAFSRLGQSLSSTSSDPISKPWSAFALIGFLSMSTIGLSNVALQHLQYATQVAFKSSKPVPVMLVGILVLGKSYSLAEYMGTFVLTAGLVLFTTADQEIGEFDPIGVLFISLALLVDGFIGNVQQRTFVAHPDITPSEMIYRTKAIAAALSLVMFVVSGELPVAVDFYSRNPHALVGVGTYSVVGVLGETFVMAMIKRFGALAAVITTSVRKALTMILSFVMFNRHFSMKYLTASVLVWSGVALHIYSDHRARQALHKKKSEVRSV